MNEIRDKILKELNDIDDNSVYSEGYKDALEFAIALLEDK